MSDTHEGPGWWQATDGRWYPPESYPSLQPLPPGATSPTGKTAPPPGHPGDPAVATDTGHPAHPGYATPGSVAPAGYVNPPGYSPHPGYSAPPGYATAPTHSGPPGYPTAPPGYPQWGAGYPPYGAVNSGRPTNGLAVASFVCSVSGIIPFFFGITCVVGIVLGFVALGQIKGSGGFQQGRGLAIAGVVVGFSLIAIFFLVIFAAGITTNQTN